MLRIVVAAGLVVAAGCRTQLSDAPTLSIGDDAVDADPNGGRDCVVNMSSQACVEADQQQPAPTLAWLEQNVFTKSCTFNGCHNGAQTPQGKIDLRAGMSYAHLVGYASAIETGRTLVVANDVHASYLMLMLHDFAPTMASPPGSPPPGDVGYMPQKMDSLCCQKLDALERWINAGAPND